LPAKISFSTERATTAEFSRRLGKDSKFARDAIAAGAAAALRRVERIGEEAVREAENRVDQLYEVRQGNRHKASQTPLHGSFFHEIWYEGTTKRGKPSFPFVVKLMSRADDRHVMALNRGSKPHAITPRDKSKFLWIPTRGLGQSVPYAFSQRPKRLQSAWLTGAPGRVGKPKQHHKTDAARQQAIEQSRYKIKKVNHPGIRASYFMEYSLEVAADRVLRSKVRVKKGR